MTAFSYSVFAKGGPVMWLLVMLGLAALDAQGLPRYHAGIAAQVACVFPD